MENNVELRYNGLKCDYCTYKDESIKREDFEISINKPCPECGENLLTFQDYINILLVEKAVEETNRIVIDEPKGEIKTVTVDTHKEIKFKDIDE